MKTGLLALTILLAVGLSVGMWAVNKVPFNAWTFSLHVVSIYIGISATVLFQRKQRDSNPRGR